MDIEEKPKGKYLPPALRKAISEGTASGAESEFERFLTYSASNRQKCESSWEHRDAELIKSPAGLNFDRYSEIPVEMSEDIAGIDGVEDCAMHPTLLANIRPLGSVKPTQVKRFSIPIGLIRKDLMACAQTGLGKTAAYMLPICIKMLTEGPTASPVARLTLSLWC